MIAAILALGILTSTSDNYTQPTSTETTQTIDRITVTDDYQIELNPGGSPINVSWQDAPSRLRTAWGASYANSTETIQFFYVGKALAAGNVFQNQRIVQVCIWYTRGTQWVSLRVCSTASSDAGYWVAGPEVMTSAIDSLDWNAPKTIFNIETTRISPSIA